MIVTECTDCKKFFDPEGRPIILPEDKISLLRQCRRIEDGLCQHCEENAERIQRLNAAAESCTVCLDPSEIFDQDMSYRERVKLRRILYEVEPQRGGGK